MLSKRYVPTQIQNLNYEETLTKHYKKLEEIQKEDRKKKNVDKEVAEKAKFTESREKTIKFHISEKTNAIEKDNELLLGRLVEISRKKPKVLAQIKSENSLPRTLNGPSRRREKSRIAAENEAFARRLLSQQPSFNPKKLELDYEKHNQRVKNMAKLTSFSPRKIRLPPIKYADFENVGSKKNQKNKKEQKKKDNENENEGQAKEIMQVKTEGDEVFDTKPDITNNEAVKAEEINNHEAEEIALKEKEAREKEAREKEAKENEAREKEMQEKEAKEKEAREKEVQEKAAQEDLAIQDEDSKKPTSSAAIDNKSSVLTESQQPKVENNSEQNVQDNEAPKSIVEENQPEDKPVEEAEVETEQQEAQEPVEAVNTN